MESKVETRRYPLYILGPAADRYPDLLGPQLENDIKALGLVPKDDFRFVYGGDPDAIDDRDGPVGAWFGGTEAPDPGHLRVLDRLRAIGAPVLPLVPDLKKFTSYVPDQLKPINGMAWDDPQVPSDLLRGFRLTRNLRQAFISYRRIESQGVADALFEVLSHRRYHAFLDTASVESMEPFQNVLWDRLADMDMILLLDTPNALSSQYVTDELVQVNQLGLGVLQLIWPDHTPKKETELSRRCRLAPDDFVKGDFGPSGVLKTETLQKITALAESVRIESLAARRRRVVGDFLTRIPSTLRVEVQSVGPLVIRPGGADADEEPVAIVFPIVGLPDAQSLHREHTFLNTLRLRVHGVDDATVIDLAEKDRVRVIYDGLGVRKERAEHLLWLSRYLPLKTAPLDRGQDAGTRPGHEDLDRWLQWLAGGSGT